MPQNPQGAYVAVNQGHLVPLNTDDNGNLKVATAATEGVSVLHITTTRVLLVGGGYVDSVIVNTAHTGGIELHDCALTASITAANLINKVGSGTVGGTVVPLYAFPFVNGLTLKITSGAYNVAFRKATAA